MNFCVSVCFSVHVHDIFTYLVGMVVGVSNFVYMSNVVNK